ncbi:MAG: hypothetical protein ACJAWV_001432 [Flammeovirgaceae bacterium]|jgi:hypothetical protein
MKYINLSLILIVILLSACKNEQVLTNKKLAKKMKMETFDYEYMSIKSKVEFVQNGKEQKAAGYIRIKKDSAIWMTLSKTHIEGVRLLITKDTFLMLNRIEKIYYSYSFDELSKKFNFPFNFQMLQSAITGELYWEGSETPEPIKTAEYFILKGMIQALNVENRVSRANNKLEQITVSDKSENQLDISYSDFEEIEGKLFANKSNSTLNFKDSKNEEKEIKLNLDFSKVKIFEEPLSLPFKLSDKYKRAEW